MKASQLATPPGAPRPIERWLTPLQRFAALEASGGIVLILATIAALVWANWGAAHSYERFFHTPVSVGFGDWLLSKSLQHWINDGLMAIFFFVVGLEIKRELLIGELSSFKKAALPVAGALGGMIAPALLYLSLNAGTTEAAGWGVPMATDIAFVIGALTLFGSRVPPSLKVFLVALAIADDMGAVLVIALFYTASINLVALYVGASIVIVLVVLSGLGTRHPLVYALLGVALWLAVLNSGIHATIAGILLALTVPASTRIGTDQLISRGRELLNELEESERSEPGGPTTQDELDLLAALEAECERAETPMQRLERTLHPWSVFLIMPVFALANAGVPLDATAFSVTPLAAGIFLGLVVGKPLGISLLAWLAVRTRIATLGAGVTMSQVLAAGCLGGIGFTMSIFIATLAFDEQALNLSKAAILVSSLVAALLGSVMLYLVTRRRTVAPQA